MDLPTNFSSNPHIKSAHDACRTVEGSLKERIESTEDRSVAKVLQKQLINVRILGRILEFCPTQIGKNKIATEVFTALKEVKTKDLHSSASHDALSNLGEFYDRFFIRSFRKAKGSTTQMSGHPSRPSFDHESDLMKELLVGCPKDHRQAKESALIRDNLRCILSGKVDHRFAPDNLRKDRNNQISPPGLTHCAHIFSESTNTNLDDEHKRNHAANAWAVMDRFGLSEIRRELEGQKIHRLSNILTLDSALHDLFDNLQLWLQPTAESNVYNIGAQDEELVFEGYRIPRSILLSSRNPRLELPNPEYLRVHASCCHIANLSGAVSYLDQMEDVLPSTVLPLKGDFSEVLTARHYDLEMSQRLIEVGKEREAKQ
ncbi:hypothetical protein BT69DRAFT_1284910 [Atractiella rhizophila]|nr:hypothetical protein BT69DRAFT_1284910 [Atractiella rhizophila]